MEQLQPHFQLKLVNGMQGDPAVYGFAPKTGDALLFDLGTLDNLTHKDLLRVRTAMVSHAHVDHFIGFDRLLRVNIPHYRCIELCGPKDFHNNVLGKLQGYTWNLVDPGQIQFIVHEISDNGEVKHVRITNDRSFSVETFVPEVSKLKDTLPQVSQPGALVAELDNLAGIYAVSLDHGTSSIAYSVHIPGSQHVKVEVLDKLGLKPGPWIRELQVKVATKKFGGNMTVDGKTFKVTDLVDKLIESLPGRAVSYLTDICFSLENLRRFKTIANNSTLLICEANFRDEDVAKAFAKKHLTTKQAALIAAFIGAANLEIFHVSNIYPEQAHLSVEEAQKFFREFRALAPQDLEGEITKELARAKT